MLLAVEFIQKSKEEAYKLEGTLTENL